MAPLGPGVLFEYWFAYWWSTVVSDVRGEMEGGEPNCGGQTSIVLCPKAQLPPPLPPPPFPLFSLAGPSPGEGQQGRTGERGRGEGRGEGGPLSGLSGTKPQKIN